MSPIKICGLTRADDALAAAEAGANLLGIIFHPPSSRAVRPTEASSLVREIRQRTPSAKWVGVFVDTPIEQIRQVVDTVGIDGVQLHGDEDPEVVDRLVRDGLFVIKAFRVATRADLEGLDAYAPSAFLLDTFVPGRHGGTGQTFDWSIAVHAAAERRILLSGGLTPGNVASAVEAVHPWGVDVSSGVESSPGRKDVEKMRTFIAAAERALDGKGSE
ncbi:MAG: phosphoribosylanthranilate isomerase [Candidatus Bipolaricaulia bacterium]